MMSSNLDPVLAFLFPSMGWPEMLMIFGVILLIFGPQKLPEIADALGRSIRKFKAATSEVQNDLKRDITHDVDSDDKRTPKQD